MVFEAETEKPDAKVKWQCNAKDVVNGDKYAIAADGSKHSLSIKAVTHDDANIYAVISGGSKVKFELKVVSKPGGGTLMLQLCVYGGCWLTCTLHLHPRALNNKKRKKKTGAGLRRETHPRNRY